MKKVEKAESERAGASQIRACDVVIVSWSSRRWRPGCLPQRRSLQLVHNEFSA